MSHEWIYQHIYHDRRHDAYSQRGTLVNQIRIDERPAVVTEKSRLGDWEIDSVIGKGHQQSIVTMVERQTKLLRMKKIDHKTGSLTRDAICAELQDLVVKTITSDNGKEFSEHAEIARKLQADFYFCPPYSSWERGVNENTNGLIL